MVKSFDITDSYVIPQFNLIGRVLYDYKLQCTIAYTSNWYMVICCIDVDVSQTIIAKLKRIDTWQMDLSAGRKQRYHYIKLKFNQSN